ncbi:MAG: PAS domain S-box protein, partial [Bacteroidetes bacterium]|nr:PAS domain S-box protein [Bacteroidota bacterium]
GAVADFLHSMSLNTDFAKTVLDLNPSAIYIQDTSHRYLWANRAAGINSKISPEKLTGRFCYNVWEGRDQPCPDCPVEIAMKTGSSAQLDRKTPDGRHWSVRAIPVKNNSGEIVNFLEIADDITKRKEQELNVEESEVRFRNLAESTPIGIMIYQGEYFVYANPACKKIFGYEPEELYRMHYWDLVDKEHRSVIIERGRKRIAGEIVPEEYQFQMKTKSGEVKWILINGARIDFHGKPAGLVTLNDISERKRAEDLLEESEKKYRTLSDAAFEAIFISEKGLCIEQNEAARRMFGYTDEEAIGKSDTEWIDPKDRDQVMQNTLSGYEMSYQVNAIRKDRSVFPCIVQGRMMHYQGRKVRVISLIDITPQKQAEQIMSARIRLSEFATDHTVDELLQKTLDEAEALTGSQIGFYHFLEQDQKTLSLQVWSTNTLLNLCTAEAKGMHYHIDKAGVWVDCVREGRAVIHNDYASLPHRKGVPEGHAPVIRELVVPVFRENKIVAIIGIGNKPSDYDLKDQEVITLLADLAWDITKRKQAEEALKLSEDRYRKAFHTSPDSIAITRLKDGVFVSVNKGFVEISGYTQEEVIGKSSLEINIWKNPKDRQKVVDGLLSHGEVRNFEAEFLTKKGVISGLMSAQIIELNGERHILNITRDITHQKLAESALKESETRFRSVLQNVSSVAVQGYNSNGIVQYWNHASELLYGYSAEEAMGKNLVDLIIPSEMREEVKKAIASMIESGQPIPASELVLMKKDKSLVHVFSSHVVVKPEGRSAELFCIDVDLTERRKMELTLKESKDRYQQLFINSPSGVLLIDKNGIILEANQAIADSTLYTTEELTGMDVRKLTLPEDMHYVNSNILKILSGQVLEQEVSTLRKDGSQAVFILRETSIILPDGQPGILSVSNDITESKRAEEALRFIERRYKALIDKAPDGIVMIADGKFKYCSPSGYKMFGYDPGELESLEPDTLTHPDDLPVVLDVLQKITENPDFIPTIQYRLRHKKGHYLWIESTFSNLIAEPAVNAIVINFRDITQRKQDEFDLRASEQQFRTLFEGANDSIFIMSEEEFIECNDMTLKIFGCDDKNDIIHHFPWEFSPEEQPDGKPSSEKAKKYIHAALKGKPQRFYWKHIRKNGHPFDAEVSLNRLEIDEGRYLQAIVRDITERMRSEEALKLSEERYRLLVQQSPLPMGLTDKEKNILYLNDQFINIFGYTIESIPTVEHFYKVAFPDDNYRKYVSESWESALKNYHGINLPIPVLEFRITCKDGKVRTVETSATFIGEIILTTFHDITVRKQAETALRESEAKYRLLAEHMTDTVWLMDMNLTMLYVSPSVEKLRGFTLKEIQDLPLEKNLAHESVQKGLEVFAEEMQKIVNDPAHSFIRNVELEFWKKDGSTVWLECSFSLIRDENGNPESILGEGKDITERKQAESEKERDRQIQKALNEILRISAGSIPLNENLDQVLKIMLTAPFLKVMQQGCIFLADEKHSELIMSSSYYFPEVLQKSCNIVPFGYCVCGRTAITREIQYCSSADEIHERHFPDQDPHGHYCIPIISEDKVLGVILVYLPETHAKERFEVDFYRAVADILSGVIQRKRAETELVTAKERAEASDQLKTAFLNNISHELRTPLNGILGFAEFALQEDISEEDKIEYLGFINENSDRLLSTVTNYMDSSLIASGTMEAKTTTFNLNQLLLTIDAKYQPVAAKKNLELRMQFPPNSDKMLIGSDQELIRKILMHLIDNALKFTSIGSVTFGYDHKDSNLEFFVKDTGPGIGKDSRQRIFEPFIQGEVSNTRGYEGSGLGLSLAKGMTELLGGQIRVESALNKGSAFYVNIPQPGMIMKPDEAPKTAVQVRAAKNPVILIAEDDHYNFLYLETVLRDTTAKIIHAVNGAEAIDICTRRPEVSLVLMDVKMPVMNGLEATRRIKASRGELPIIAVTAYALSNDERLALNAGCDDYLSKPLTKEQLLEKIRKYVTI